MQFFESLYDFYFLPKSNLPLFFVIILDCNNHCYNLRYWSLQMMPNDVIYFGDLIGKNQAFTHKFDVFNFLKQNNFFQKKKMT